MWVLIIGVAWEIFEVYVEGTEETYGTKKKWAINTASDLFVEIGAAWWMVLPAGSLIGQDIRYILYYYLDKSDNRYYHMAWKC